MSVGIRIRGIAGNIQIDENSPVFMVAERGVISGANLEQIQKLDWDLGNRHRVRFATPYTSYAPPLIFLKFLDADRAMNMFTMEGGPGNWTGFNISVGQIVPQYNAENGAPVYQLITHVGCNLAWFAATPASVRSTATYGMRIRNRNTGALVFDSGWPLVKFLSQTSAFQPLGRLQHTHAFLRYGVGRPGGDVYFMANAISGAFGSNTGGLPIMMGVGVESSFPNQQLVYCYSAQGDVPYQSYLWTVLFASPGA